MSEIEERDKAFFDKVVQDGKKAQDLDDFMGKLSETLRNSTDPEYTPKERAAFKKKVRLAISGSRPLDVMLDALNEIVEIGGRERFNKTHVGDMRIAEEAQPKGIAAKEYREGNLSRWDNVNTYVTAFEKLDPSASAWLERVLAVAKDLAAQTIRTLKISKPFHPYADVDLRKWKSRDKYYNYWESVSKMYEEDMHHDFLEALKKDGVDAELKKKIDKLLGMKAPPITIEKERVPFFSEGNRMPEVLDAFLDRVLDDEDEVYFTTGGYFETKEKGGARTGRKIGEMDDTRYKNEDKDIQSRMQESRENLEESSVDPLLWYAVREGMVSVPFTRKTWDDIGLLVKDEQGNITEEPTPEAKEVMTILIDIDEEIFNEFVEFTEEIDQSLDNFTQDIFYLPFGDLDISEEDVPAQRDEFFRLLGDIVKVVPERFSIEQPKAKVGMGGDSEGIGPEVKQGKILENLLGGAAEISYPKAEGQDLSMTPSTQKKFDELLKLLSNYYITPMQSNYFYEGRPRFVGLNQFQNLILRADGHPMQKRLKRIQNANVKNFSSDDVEQITKFLVELEVRTEDIDRTILRLGTDAVRGLDSILGRDDDNKVFVGNLMGQIAKMRAQDTKSILFYKKPLDHWIEIYQDSPINQLNEVQNFFESTPIKANLNLRDTTRPIQDSLIIERYRDKESPERKKFEAVKKLVSKIVEFKKSLDPIAMKLLHAHDVIRKMMGKELSYARFNINDPDHMDMLMQKVPITAPEISNIVKSYDSHRNLSLNYGISEDDVYMIKGLCR
tara:strand:- start:1485 stop:3833 length:2349 start_codon:yes stop_codon:yes gene_type:complete